MIFISEEIGKQMKREIAAKQSGTDNMVKAIKRIYLNKKMQI
jgi:hypothetical protein